MKLIEAATLEIHDFADVDNAPPYAILSHRWGDGECSFQHWRDPQTSERKGYRKIERCCKQALHDGLQWAWVDSCCIEKSSSAELSEAINSMYLWYQRAKICYAYLEDVRSLEDMRNSEWFGRGWTLQELVAPQKMAFFNTYWLEIGTKAGLTDVLSQITGISREVLATGVIQRVSIAERMSWAAGRRTTRIEDMAYCLLGICEVNIPLLYGEGKKSFIRLHEEILRTSREYSLLLWGLPKTLRSIDAFHVDGVRQGSSWSGLLADGPGAFSFSQDIIRVTRWKTRLNPVITGGGVEMSLPVRRHKDIMLAALPYSLETRRNCYITMPLRENGDDSFSRLSELILTEGHHPLDTHRNASQVNIGHEVPTIDQEWSTHRILIAAPNAYIDPPPSIRHLEFSGLGAQKSFMLELVDVHCRRHASFDMQTKQVYLHSTVAGPFALLHLRCYKQGSTKFDFSRSKNFVLCVGLASDHSRGPEDFRILSMFEFEITRSKPDLPPKAWSKAVDYFDNHRTEFPLLRFSLLRLSIHVRIEFSAAWRTLVDQKMILGISIDVTSW